MNAILLAVTMLAMGAPDVQTSPDAKTQLYVKTAPPGAEVAVDDKPLGKSNAMFDVAAGPHKLSLSLGGYAACERSIEVSDGEITRVEVELKKRSGRQTVLSYVGEVCGDKQSFADSGHAVAFERPTEMKSIIAVKLFAARYGYPRAPKENFHIYLLDQNQKVLEQVAVPYRKIERGEMEWQTIEFPAIAAPEKFFVAVWFNAEATKGVYLGKQNDVQQTHSYTGLPDKGFEKVTESYDWMIRAVVSSEDGKKPTHPKVTTYGEEKAADTESAEAQPEDDDSPSAQGRSATRTWNDATGAFSVEAKFAGVKDGKVLLKKANGKTVAVPLDQLCKEDREFVAQQTDAKVQRATPDALETRELKLDNGKMASKSSIAGGGHAVKFNVEGGSNYVTSVSLHGSRYGMPKPPKESFQVWICNAKFKPIATFRFPYGSYTRSNPDWKSFRIRPTRVPQEFIVCFGFNPQQTKGVYVSYDDQPSKTSMIGVPGKLEPEPFTKGNWLIRCKVENRGGSGQSEEPSRR